MASVNLKISGMSCGHCVMAVKNALKAVPGVGEFQVEVGKASVNFDPAQANVAALRAAVEDAGYEVVGAQ